MLKDSNVELLAELLQGGLGAGFIALGLAALFGSRLWWISSFSLHVPLWVNRFSAVVAILGGLGLLVSIVITPLAFFIVAPLAVVCLIALGLRIFSKSRKEAVTWVLPVALIGGLAAVAVLQPMGLRLLALTRPDDFPIQLVSVFKTIQRLPDNFWIEGLVFGPDGSMYTSATSGMELPTHGYSKATAKVFKREPHGAESEYFSLPNGVLAGVLVCAADGILYLNSSGATNGVWSITGKGHGRLLAELPKDGWPNGMSLGPDGQLYVTDSKLGVIWRVDPQTGKTEAALTHALLKPRTFVALAPGANGIHFREHDAFVVVSDTGQIVRSRLNPDGSFETPVVYASGVPGDDFAFAPDGTIYLATHYYNTVVRIDPNGSRVIIADARQGVTGGTDVAFAPGDDNTLYVSTDDGAIAGNAKPNGTVVALTLAANH